MKMDEVFKKCLEIPGISLNQGTYSSEMILKQKEGKGSMTIFPLFPGITLAYIFVNSPFWPAPKLSPDGSDSKGPLIINYCVNGRCELILNNESYVYITEGQLSLTEQYAQDRYIYPRRIYEGLEFFLDPDTVAEYAPYLAEQFDIDLHKLPERFCPDGKTYIADSSAEIAAILDRLWALVDCSDAFTMRQMKLTALDLFGHLLAEKHISTSKACTFYTESQVAIAKNVEKIITSDLRQHHPAWELAETFSVSETSLKNYFRGVFGQNISVYLRDARMNRAAELLSSTQQSVSDIAELVGYANQSKFASVFKKQFDVSPLEYRRLKRLENTRRKEF